MGCHVLFVMRRGFRDGFPPVRAGASCAVEAACEGFLRAAVLPFAPCPELGGRQLADECPPADTAFVQAARAAVVDRDRPEAALHVFQPRPEPGRFLASDIGLAAIVELVLAAVIIGFDGGRRRPGALLPVPRQVQAPVRAGGRRPSRARRGACADGRAGRGRRGGVRRGAVVRRRRWRRRIGAAGPGGRQLFGQHRRQGGAGVGCGHGLSFVRPGAAVPLPRVSCAGGPARRRRRGSHA